MAGEHVRDGKASYRSQSYITDVKTNERKKKRLHTQERQKITERKT